MLLEKITQYSQKDKTAANVFRNLLKEYKNDEYKENFFCWHIEYAETKYTLLWG